MSSSNVTSTISQLFANIEKQLKWLKSQSGSKQELKQFNNSIADVEQNVAKVKQFSLALHQKLTDSSKIDAKFAELKDSEIDEMIRDVTNESNIPNGIPLSTYSSQIQKAIKKPVMLYSSSVNQT